MSEKVDEEEQVGSGALFCGGGAPDGVDCMVEGGKGLVTKMQCVVRGEMSGEGVRMYQRGR